jgi:hypothetical protein
MKYQVKLTKFEAEELGYKIEVLIDSGADMLDDIGYTESELENLDNRLIPGLFVMDERDYNLIKEEAEDILNICESNYYAGFPEYKNAMIKLRKLVNKLSLALSIL